MSLRKLSEICKISPSTVSRIINSKQSASIWQLQALSEHLKIPLTHLLKASGLDISSNTDENSEIILSVIYNILKSYDIEYNEIVSEIRRDLKKCEHYAGTTDGKGLIQSSFFNKIESLHGEGIIIERLKKLYQLFCSEKAEACIQNIAGSALLYFISTPDVIPDYAFPIVHLDDAVAVQLTMKRLEEEYGVILI